MDGGIPRLNDPLLVAVWPGMGHVAANAGIYLMAKLGMDLLAELPADQFFEVEHVEVSEGLVRAGRPPRSRFFVWRDPAGRRDLVLFLGEAQPTHGKSAFCQGLVEFAERLGVRRVFTFAAMATEMLPGQPARVFVAATDEASLDALRPHDPEVLEQGRISGLNGVLLGVAAQHGMTGVCLLGEMPRVFAQLPYPRASLRVLETFAAFAAVEIGLGELAEQADAMDERLGEIVERIERAQRGESDEDWRGGEPAAEVEEPLLGPEDERRLERLFADAVRDRSKAYELKRELDRLDVFREYEDRFLDLFQRPR